jgi:hypothetical protein
MKKIRLTESELIRLVKRVISEQNDILIKKGYVLGDVNTLTGQQKDFVTRYMKRYPNEQYYTKGNVSLRSDGKKVVFIVPPKGWDKGLGPHDISSIDRYL